MSKHIWIDTYSGTWGEADKLMLISLDDLEKAPGFEGLAEIEMYDALDSMSDEDIANLGIAGGKNAQEVLDVQ